MLLCDDCHEPVDAGEVEHAIEERGGFLFGGHALEEVTPYIVVLCPLCSRTGQVEVEL